MSRRTPVIAAAVLAGTGLMVWWWQRPQGAETRAYPDNTDSRRIVQAPQEAVLNPAVAALLSTEAVSLADRSAILSAIGGHLTNADHEALLASITNSPPNGLTEGEWHSLADGIFRTLRRQQPPVPQYTDHLLGLWHDRNLDPTLRDYALQHLREWVADHDVRTAHEDRPEKIGLIVHAFIDAVTRGHPDCDPQSTTTGTALLALDEWANAHPPPAGLDPARVRKLLLAHAASPESHRGVRSTSLQLCASRNVTEALPVARDILANRSSEAILCMSAIATLGALGTPEDLSYLAEYERQERLDPLLRTSLRKALQDLNQRAR